MNAIFLGVVDPNLIGLGTLSGALVVAIGYMLAHGRDTDRRVDRANQLMIDSVTRENERLVRERDAILKRSEDEKVAMQRRLDQVEEHAQVLQADLEEERERSGILRYRLALLEGKPPHESTDQ